MRINRIRRSCIAAVILLNSVGVSSALDKDLTYCANEPDAIVSDACVSYHDLEQLNNELRPLITDITQHTDYFGYYRLDLFGKECPFWSDENGMCGNRACAVDVIESEDDIPEIWRAAELGKLAGPKASHPTPESKIRQEEPSPLRGALGPDTSESCVFESDVADERDYCVAEDETAEQGVYVSLVANPERFTGYMGRSAHNVWDAVYRENCFVKAQQPPSGSLIPSGGFPNPGLANDLKNVLDRKRHEIIPAGLAPAPEMENECLEKRVFHRVISGMHASISMHLCWDYLNQTTGTWGPNLECYMERLHDHPDRIQNIYFNYALVMRAVAKLRNHFETYTFCSGDAAEDRLTKSRILKLAQRAARPPPIFDETLMFKSSEIGLKEDFRNRFRNVSRLMDCVSCDKCRLWGKVQTSGYGTALKVLFEYDEENRDEDQLRRTELVALVNTLGRLSASLTAATKFRAMVEARKTGDDVEAVLAESWDEDHVEEVPQQGRLVEELSVGEQISEEIGNVVHALKYVLLSWWYMPGQLYRLSLYYVSIFWDVFIGRDKYIFRNPPYVLKVNEEQKAKVEKEL